MVGLDLIPEAGFALLDGILSHPVKLLAQTTVDLLATVTAGETNREPIQRLLPFVIHTPEKSDAPDWWPYRYDLSSAASCRAGRGTTAIGAYSP